MEKREGSSIGFVLVKWTRGKEYHYVSILTPRVWVLGASDVGVCVCVSSFRC